MRFRRSILLFFCLMFAVWLAACRAAETLPDYPPARVASGDPLRGRVKYGTDHLALCGRVLCATCHGTDGRGLAGLGPDLVNSPLVRGLPDAQLVTFITLGRSARDPANTTGVEMPPRGGNPLLTDQDLADIVAYLRTLQP